MNFDNLEETDIEFLYNDEVYNKHNKIGCICYCNNNNIGDVVFGYGCWGPNGYNYTCGSLCADSCSFYLYGSNRGICSFTCDGNKGGNIYIDPKAYCYK